ncbi:MAG: amidohydrolase family protein, partial [Betaproteobacteria bacterium]
MKIYHAISADSHVNEPPDMFTRFFPEALRDRAPRLIELDNGGQAWSLEGLKSPIPFASTAVNYRAQKRFDRANYKKKFEEYRDGMQRGVRYEDILPGSWDPKARLIEQDEDSVDAEVMYNSPQIWAGVKGMSDPKLQLACFRAYNDWMAEFCSHDPSRLIGVGLIPVTGIEDAISELHRCVEELKLPTVALESFPSGDFRQISSEDDRFWQAAVDLDIPVSVHLSIKMPPDVGVAFFRGKGTEVRKVIAEGHFARVLEKMILTGVFDRFPSLQFVGAEVNGGWVPHYLETFDRTFKARGRDAGCNLRLLPSEYFARNVYITFIIDPLAVDNRYAIGVDRMMWNSDFPHSVSNWPIDVELAEVQLFGSNVPDDE